MKKIPLLLFICSIFLISNCKRDDIVDIVDNDDGQDEQSDDDQENDSTTDLETDASFELIANDLEVRPMQPLAKPAYLDTVVDPSFGTTIRRISDAGDGNIIKPMYSTIQAWNADESYMILYDQSNGAHQLLNGMDYTFIRNLDDVYPSDIEQIFWDFDDPDIFFYVDKIENELTRYSVSTGNKEVIVDLRDLVDCPVYVKSGNDVQMMSWDSDVIGFRCDNDIAYYYRISTGELTTFDIDDIGYIAPMSGPSGERFYHSQGVYGEDGNRLLDLNEKKVEHSCLGSLADGSDAHFAVAFAEGPQGGCLGNIIAHDLTTGECFPVISEEQGYPYSQSGTHISAVAHKNPGWVAASMVGYDEDGQSLLDQELVLARVEKGNVDVYRIGHHRADEKEFDYWGEPHAVISPTGTRVLFGSDWSGEEDGKSVDSYVVELPAFMQ